MGRSGTPVRKLPKVRSWIRPTRVHTPKPKKPHKHPKTEFETEWDITKKGQ